MYLIDTHALIWSLFDTDKLSDKAEQIITEDDSVFVSIASLWEIAIKQAIGKLDIDCSIMEIANQCIELDIDIIGIHPQHLDAIKNLPPYHNDPFDRLIIAQAMEEGYTLITKDSIIPRYDIKTIW